MRKILTLTCALILPLSAWAADTPAASSPPDHAAVRERLLEVFDQQFIGFRSEANKLAAEAQGFCAGDIPLPEVKESFRATWLAWAPLDAYQFGPMETLGAALSVNFFPDKKGFVGRALKQLRKLPAKEQAAQPTIARYSVAAQGLPAIERLLYDDPTPCPLLVGITGQLSHTATALYDGWFADQGWADLARSAGPENPIYLSDEEFSRQVFTALGFSILRMRDHRLKRPLGSYVRAFPKRSEAWRSGLTNQIIDAQLAGMEQVIDQGFGSAVPTEALTQTDEMIADLHHRLNKIDLPLKDAVEDPLLRVRIEGVISKFQTLQLFLDETVGPGLAVQAGFSAGDGD